MISHHEKFELPDQNKAHNFHLEVNWNTNDPITNECKVVKFTFPDGKQAFVRREHLHSILFAIGRLEDQGKLIPQKQETIRNIETVLGIKASKHIEKGEMINVRVKIPIPLSQQETIGSAPKGTQLIT